MTKEQLVEYLENILTIETAIQQETEATILLDHQARSLGYSMKDHRTSSTSNNLSLIAFNDYRRCIEQGVDTCLMKYPA